MKTIQFREFAFFPPPPPPPTSVITGKVCTYKDTFNSQNFTATAAKLARFHHKYVFAESIPARLKYFYTSFKGCRLKEIKCLALLNGFALVGELILFSYLLQMLCTGCRRPRRPASSVCSLTSFKCTGWRRTGSVLLPPSRQCCCLEDRFCSLTSCKTVLLSGEGQVLFSCLLQV